MNNFRALAVALIKQDKLDDMTIKSIFIGDFESVKGYMSWKVEFGG